MEKANLKDLYINFFVENGHVQIPSAPVVPENDPSVLFNTAGMQPLVPYLMGQKHPLGTRLCDYQKCIRTNDLDSIGDKTHHTFFEMLGNWSLGDYFKKESITWSFAFLTKVLNIPVEKLAVTVFEGNDEVPRDEESANVWKSLGIPQERISYLDKDNNFWIAGEVGPCGPDTEIFYWRSNDPVPQKHDPEDERWVEIWNNVFMQYERHQDGTVTELPHKNVDTGMGVERTVAILEGVDDNYLTSIWKDVVDKIEEMSNTTYAENAKSIRIIADHIRTAVFISGDNSGIKPSNTDQGYILRRLIRRMIRHAKKIGIDLESGFERTLALMIIEKYAKYYDELEKNKEIILDVLTNELKKFNRTLEKGLRVDKAGFEQKFKEHQEKSRAGSEQRFKGGLAGDGEVETKYHTATHLLNAALKQVISKDVHQRGSNITVERMRFDFNCDHKLTDEEKQKVEDLVNEWIKQEIPVTVEEMSKQEAIDSGAECMFIEKYPDVVTVYSIGNISKELCGGPHVQNTKELGHFKIKKEEASSAGVRRIKAILE